MGVCLKNMGKDLTPMRPLAPLNSIIICKRGSIGALEAY